MAGRLSVFLLLLAAALASAGQDLSVDTSQGIFHPAFRSLRVTLAGDEFAPPVVALRDGDSRIEISFDEISDERRFMRYELVHCDARWRPEGLVASEFLDGFNEGIVEDYDFSRATLVHYVHYTITVPNGDVRITQPGNYLLRVYDESDPDETLLQARFGVADFSAGVVATVSSKTDIDTNRSHQQLEIALDLSRTGGVADPYNDLTVVISQNGRTDNEVVLTTPQRVAGSRVFYSHLRPLIFPAGNEYRRFETVSTTYPGMGVAEVRYDAPVYNMQLYTDEPRANGKYLYDSTQHGRFFIREWSSDNSDTEADYVMTHFSLAMPEMTGGDVFIDGDLTQRRFDTSSRMVYNQATGAYEQSMLLKQGAYNYQYLYLPFGATRGENSIEGNYYETVNEYTVRVYHRPRGSRFDRLIGVALVKSGV